MKNHFKFKILTFIFLIVFIFLTFIVEAEENITINITESTMPQVTSTGIITEKPISKSNIIIDPLWVSVLATTVLVIITAYYARETRNIRLESIRPSFSLRTGQYSLGGGMRSLFLRNTRGSARDVNVDIETSTDEKKMFFVPSLDSGQEIDTQIDFQQIKNNNGIVKVKLKFRDGYNRNLNDSFSVDFSQLLEENREIAFQSDQIEKIEKVLKEIQTSLKRKNP